MTRAREILDQRQFRSHIHSGNIEALEKAMEQHANEKVKDYIRFIFKEQELIDSEVDVMFEQFNKK